jgi:hypothetical protein
MLARAAIAGAAAARHYTPAVPIRAMSAAAAAAAAATSPAEPVKHWALHYSYVPDVMEKRAPLRAEHLALASKYKAAGKMLQGGQMNCQRRVLQGGQNNVLTCAFIFLCICSQVRM